jgi:competence protein ComEC
LPKKYEKLLVEKYGDSLKSDILLSGHHGSKTSSSDIFLKTVSPEYFVISSGENSYGHPSKEVLKKARENFFKILRTDQLGNIKFLIKKDIIFES